MNRRMIIYMVGNIVKLEAVVLMLPLLVSLCYHEMNGAFALALSVIISAVVGFVLTVVFKPDNKVIYAREGFIIVTFAWIILSLLGALPFMISGEIPNFFDAFFEIGVIIRSSGDDGDAFRIALQHFPLDLFRRQVSTVTCL